MLKEIELTNWKSFKESKLYLDPLTILIGTNSSGKSNTLDALLLLNRLASGLNVTASLAGDLNMEGLRGGMEWVCLKPNTRFSFKSISVSDTEENTEYHYKVVIEVQENQALIAEESLQRFKFRPRTQENPYKIFLFRTDAPENNAPSIIARLYNKKQGAPKHATRATSVLSQLHAQKIRKEIEEGISQVIKDLTGIFILDPIPSHMRGYTALSERLESDASNIAGVLAALDSDEKKAIESTLTSYVKHLPEKDIVRIYAETVGRFGSDAMLYCDETWGADGTPHTVDARGMSDGTLRFLAVLTALLTRPKNSILIVEEIDNGLHPSRSELLVKMLRSVGQEREIDILVTTHNPALLDALGPEMVPFITVASRNPFSGESELTLLEEIKDLPKLLASGPVGKLTTLGKIEQSLGSRDER